MSNQEVKHDRKAKSGFSKNDRNHLRLRFFPSIEPGTLEGCCFWFSLQSFSSADSGVCFGIKNNCVQFCLAKRARTAFSYFCLQTKDIQDQEKHCTASVSICIGRSGIGRHRGILSVEFEYRNGRGTDGIGWRGNSAGGTNRCLSGSVRRILESYAAAGGFRNRGAETGCHLRFSLSGRGAAFGK